MKYGPETTRQLCSLLEQGSNREDACILVGIHRDSFYDWLKNKADFSDAIKKAEAECKNRNISIIQKAAITTWQAAAWWLERKHHMEFALKQQDTREVDEIPRRMAERAQKLLKEIEANGKPKVHP